MLALCLAIQRFVCQFNDLFCNSTICFPNICITALTFDLQLLSAILQMPPEKNESTRIYLFRAMALSLTAMKYCDTHTATKTITGLLVHISLCSKFRLYIY